MLIKKTKLFVTLLPSKIFSLFLILIFIPTLSSSVIFAEVEEYQMCHFIRRDNIVNVDGTLGPRTLPIRDSIKTKKHARVIFYDTASQRLVNFDGSPASTIYYFSIPEALENYTHGVTFPGWFTINYSGVGFSIDCTPLTQDPQKSKSVHTSLPMGYNGKWVDPPAPVKSPPEKRFFGFNQRNDPINFTNLETNVVVNYLNFTTARRKETNKDVTWTYYFYDPSNLILRRTFNSTFNSDDAGNIGELITDLTHSYLGFLKIEGKYSGNKGFDGIYLKNNMLLFSESKFHHRKPCAETVLKNDLFPSVNTRLTQLETTQSLSIQAINQFLATQPVTNPLQNIFLLAMVVIPDGQVTSVAKSISSVGEELAPLKDYIARHRFPIVETKGPPLPPQVDTQIVQTTNFVQENQVDPLQYIQSLMAKLGLNDRFEIKPKEEEKKNPF